MDLLVARDAQDGFVELHPVSLTVTNSLCQDSWSMGNFLNFTLSFCFLLVWILFPLTDIVLLFLGKREPVVLYFCKSVSLCCPTNSQSFREQLLSSGCKSNPTGASERCTETGTGKTRAVASVWSLILKLEWTLKSKRRKHAKLQWNKAQWTL